MKCLSDKRLINDSTWITAAENCKKKNLPEFSKLKPRLALAYKEYDSLIVNYNSDIPNGIFHIQDKKTISLEKNLMIDYYENPPAKLSRLLSERRKEHGLNECPYCGNPKSPDTLDHFIPKGNWSEYSIYPDNLVPQCRECAPIKSEKYYSKAKSSAIYIHPLYFDILTRIGFKITTSIAGGKFSFNVVCLKSKDMSQIDFDRVLSHFAGLDVKKRILTYCHRTTSHWCRLQKSTINDSRASFERRVKEYGADCHDNWEVALYKSYLSQQEVIDYFNSLCPNKNIKTIADVEMIEAEF